jgi:predicted dehydrogenase
MTERYEITTILQKEFSKIPSVFGELVIGTPEEPAITKESIHHFFKLVAGIPLKRPAWFFDTRQQGEGIVDVNTHLVDLIQWGAFPEQILSKEDVEIVSARRWTTDLTPEMFKTITHMDKYPDYLKKDVDGNILKVYSNGEIIYQLKGIYAKASVIWNFEAPDGAKDTHYSIMRGTKCNLIIEQGKNEEYKPRLYIDSKIEGFSVQVLERAITDLSEKYSGLSLVQINDKRWAIDVPDKYKLDHEAHFAQVTEKYLQFLKEGKLPDWEVPNMITKYYTTTQALKLAREQ